MAGNTPLGLNLACGQANILADGYTAGIRLNLQFFLWKDALGFNIHPAIPVPKNDAQIADVGSGTAIWLLDVAREFPNAQLHGYDISMAQAPPTEWLPPHVVLRVWNMFDEIPDDMIGKFDVAHARLLFLFVENSDPRPILKKFQKLLKPGGYLQWDEIDYVSLTIKTINASPAAAVTRELRDFANSQGKHNWTVQLAEAAKDVGFERALLYPFDSKLEFARAEMENILQTVSEVSSRLMSGDLKEESMKIREMLESAHQQSIGSTALSIPRVVCVAQNSYVASSSDGTQELTSVPSTPHYITEIGPRLKPVVEDVFQKWSGLAGDRLMKHLYTIRDRAWAYEPYPCIGEWTFLLPGISAFPVYHSIVARVRQDDTVLDLGCCFGQNLRLLASEGVSTRNMYASDIKAELWELGFELFKDKDKMHAQFMEADIFDPQSNLRQLDGKMDIILICQFLHLFNWEQQVIVIRRIIGLSKPGTLVVGYQRAREKSLRVPVRWGEMYMHDIKTFSEIWRQAEETTGTNWDIDTSLVDMTQWGVEAEDVEWMDRDPKGMNFVLQRRE